MSLYLWHHILYLYRQSLMKWYHKNFFFGPGHYVVISRNMFFSKQFCLLAVEINIYVFSAIIWPLQQHSGQITQQLNIWMWMCYLCYSCNWEQKNLHFYCKCNWIIVITYISCYFFLKTFFTKRNICLLSE